MEVEGAKEVEVEVLVLIGCGAGDCIFSTPRHFTYFIYFNYASSFCILSYTSVCTYNSIAVVRADYFQPLIDPSFI